MAYEGVKCEISQDNLTATLFLPQPESGITYFVPEVLGILRQYGITYGIDNSEIERMIEEKDYCRAIVVAEGEEPENGKDGYYEFFFDNGSARKPVIRPDGSVDYQSMNIVHSVRKGEVLAIYHNSVPGRRGMDVRGRELRCKPGRELPEIRGGGFSVDADKVTYRAEEEGRVEYDNYKMYVRSVYELRGDLNQLTGRIDFRGDVVVHGNVCAGTMIRASKSITVEGSVEAAVLIAEGDIVLKKGMQGGKRAKITSGGNVYAFFLEYTDVSAKGNVEANIILNCKVSAGKNITVKGKKGYILGGSYYAVSMISSTVIGNATEVKTNVAVGLTEDVETRSHLLTTKLENAKKGIEKNKLAVEALMDFRICKDPRDVRDAKVSQLKRRIKRDERLLDHIEAELAEIKEVAELTADARIMADGKVFKGTIVRIGDDEITVKNDLAHVEFVKSVYGGSIEIKNI